ncbi:SDR family oxidoreductase [Pseudohongiella spirulinae]|uniref:Short-chain dehydrogenase n=1 Tax=Pseudohongiella spirulinae TaxID=1249552 RepID=A0A0S2KAY4_9GAMM|nr:SDR family oxidoreductase [Pseudohongiella spirulinae]ALO45505.1 short-chain dehydrogenase [Pseudohongiella spirulinae]
MAVYLITGTNRGIGLELVRQTLAAGHEVIATARDPQAVPALTELAASNPGLTLAALDLGDPDSFDALVGQLDGRPVDVLINNAGIYGPRDASFGKLSAEDWLTVFNIDTVAPVLLTQKLMPNLRQGADKRIAFMSSKMGSVADNGSGGSYIYRTAKSALNQAVKCLAIDLQPEQFIVLSLHPGWVRTDMGGPNGLIDTRTSAQGLLSVIQQARPVDSGAFIAYDNKRIPW